MILTRFPILLCKGSLQGGPINLTAGFVDIFFKKKYVNKSSKKVNPCHGNL